MTRIQIASDLHLEFHADKGRSLVESLDPAGVDVLVLAGDISTAAYLEGSLRMIAARYKDVVFVSGNHEGYQSSPAAVAKIRARLRKSTPNLHWLEESTVTIAGQRFVGTTLWFPDSEDAREHKKWLTDYRLIKGFEPWVYEKNRAAVRFLSSEVREGDVVVTHHLPAEESISKAYEGSPYNAFFLCDVRGIVEGYGARLWVHGHTHDSCDYMLGRTRIICNPMGYPHDLNPRFEERLVVDVDDAARGVES